MILVAAIIGLFVLPGPWNLVAFGVALVVESGEVYLWIRFLERYRVRGGAEGMMGARAVVVERCDPVGLVRVRGEIWRAESAEAGALEAGERVHVHAIKGLTARVGRAPVTVD